MTLLPNLTADLGPSTKCHESRQ